MTITGEVVKAVCPHCVDPEGWAAALQAAAEKFGISNAREQAAWLAQIAEESGELTRIEENLSYSAQRLCAVFPTRFPTLESANEYAHNPHGLADKIYGGRFGNSPTEGYFFRGRGPIQITFRQNYQAFADTTKLPGVVLCPDQLLTKTIGALSAAWYWNVHRDNAFADAGQFDSVTRTINAGMVGEAAREAYWAKSKSALHVI